MQNSTTFRQLILEADSAHSEGDIDTEIDLRLHAFFLSEGQTVRSVEEIEKVAHLLCDIGDTLPDPSSEEEWQQATRHAQSRHGLIEGAILELVKAESPERAFSITQRIKSPFLVRRLRAHTRTRGDLSTTAMDYRDRLAEKEAVQNELRQARRGSGDKTRLHDLQRKSIEVYERLHLAELRLREEDPKALAGFGAPLQLDDLLPLFPPDGSGCLLDLYFGVNESAVLVAFRDGEHVRIKAGLAPDLKLSSLIDRTRAWFEAYSSGDPNKSYEELIALAIFLGEKLMHRLGETLDQQGHWQVTIIPHLVTHMLPLHLAALFKENIPGTFGEHFAVSYAPCVQLALTTALRPRPKEFVDGSLRALLLCDPLQDLPAARFEQQKVALQLAAHPWPAARVLQDQLVGPDMTRKNIDLKIPSAGLIGLATHADFHWGDPYGSGLVVASEVEQEPEIWSIDQIFTGAHLKNNPIVILSACESGMVHFEESAQVVAVPPAFVSIGAAAVLASFWPVEDVSASFFVERFVHHLMDPGETPATALHEACTDTQQITRDQALDRIDEILTDMENNKTHLTQSGKDAYLQLSGLRQRVATGPEKPFASPVFWGAFFITGCGWRSVEGKGVSIRNADVLIGMMEAIAAVQSAKGLFDVERYKECSDVLRKAIPSLDGMWLGRALLMLGDAIFRLPEASEPQLNEAQETLKRALEILSAQGDQDSARYCDSLITRIQMLKMRIGRSAAS